MPTLNPADAPRSITLCLQPRQLGRLDALVSAYRNRAEYVSRSALVRQALNLGLDAMIADDADGEEMVDNVPASDTRGITNTAEVITATP